MRNFIITESLLLRLLQAEDELTVLQCAGVASWDGIDYACEKVNRELQEAEELTDGMLPPGIKLYHARGMTPDLLRCDDADVTELVEQFIAHAHKQLGRKILYLEDIKYEADMMSARPVFERGLRPEDPIVYSQYNMRSKE